MRILSLLVVLLVANVGAPAWAQTWTTYTSEGGRYRVELPQQPQLSTANAHLQDGSTPPVYLATATAGPATCIVSYSDFPAHYLDGVPPERTLEQIRGVPTDDHKLLRDQPIIIAGHPGREYVVVLKNSRTLVFRTTLVGPRLYQLVYGVAGQIDPTSPDVRRFLDSFTPQ
jgi:hypothetical protein